jgi:hypothetical protein
VISSEHLDALLEIWAHGVIGDGSVYRNLWYPRHTAVEGWLKRGGISSTPAQHDMIDGADAFELADRAMAVLQHHRGCWYDVIVQRFCSTGPDEVRAQRLGIHVDEFKAKLASARRWLRIELGGSQCK